MKRSYYLSKMCMRATTTKEKVLEVLNAPDRWLSPEQKKSETLQRDLEIMQQLYSGDTAKQVAAQHGVKVSCVYNIMRPLDEQLYHRLRCDCAREEFKNVVSIELLMRATELTWDVWWFFLEHTRCCLADVHPQDAELLRNYLYGVPFDGFAEAVGMPEEELYDMFALLMMQLKEKAPVWNRVIASWDADRETRSWDAIAATYGVSKTALKRFLKESRSGFFMWPHAVKLIQAWAEGASAFEASVSTGIKIEELQNHLRLARSAFSRWLAGNHPEVSERATRMMHAVSLMDNLHSCNVNLSMT